MEPAPANIQDPTAAGLSRSPVVSLALSRAATWHASDVHAKPGAKPWVRRGGTFMAMDDMPDLTENELRAAIEDIGGYESSTTILQRDTTGDATGNPSGTVSRWRATTYGAVAGSQIAFRRIPEMPPQLELLGLPDEIRSLASKDAGLIITSGATGSGKTTTLAALVRQIAETRSEHILTIEDPIEYRYPDARSFITQREIPSIGYRAALEIAMRSDPNVVLLGECRTREEFEGCMDLAATGHLVLTTLHARDAATTCERIATVTEDPGRAMLSQTLLAIVSQRLLPTAEDRSKRHCAAEVMLNNHACASAIALDGNIRDIRLHLSNEGKSLDRVMAKMVLDGKILEETALSNAIDPDSLNEYLKIQNQ